MEDEEEEEAEEGEAVVGEIFSKKKSYPLIVSFFTFVSTAGALVVVTV